MKWALLKQELQALYIKVCTKLEQIQCLKKQTGQVQAGSLRSLNHDDICILEALFELYLFTLIQNDTCLSISSILKYEDETKNGLPIKAFGMHKIKVAFQNKFWSVYFFVQCNCDGDLFTR